MISIIISSLCTLKSFIFLPDISPNLNHKSLSTGYFYHIIALLSPKPKLGTFPSKAALSLNFFSVTINSSGLCSTISAFLVMKTVVKGKLSLAMYFKQTHLLCQRDNTSIRWFLVGASAMYCNSCMNSFSRMLTQN